MSIVLIAVAAALAVMPQTALGASPVVKTVPFVPANTLIPHDTWSGKAITLKGTSDSGGGNFAWTWDFGDGSPVATGIVTNKYVIGASHTYTGTTGNVFTARLTVQNTTTGETGSQVYYVQIRDKSLGVEVNVAVDEGLWYLHRDMYRYSSGGVDYGAWTSGQAGGYASLGYYSVSAANLNAFEVNGHLETGNQNNPYVETVQRAMRNIFPMLAAGPMTAWTGNPFEFNAYTGMYDKTHDGNSNGQQVWVNQGVPWYQGGMFMDAIVASGTPDAIATTGPAGIIGKSYKDIVQDMLDAYAGAQYDYYPAGGGWRYDYNQWPDGSVCQWAAIGIIAAERQWGCVVPSWLKPWNVVWLNYCHNPAGWFGYDGPGSIPWGPFALSPSGMVQCSMDGVGRGNPMWDSVESYIRDTFDNTPAYWGNNVKGYYYGLFSFVKSMLFHDNNGDGIAEPLQYLVSTSGSGLPPIDWYTAEVSKGDTSDGVARTIINDQSSEGYWYGQNYEWEQNHLQTAFAIMMLNRTVIESGSPVAVIQAIPNPAVVGQTINVNGSSSYHQDVTKSIVLWQWDLDNDGQFDDAAGPTVNVGPYGALGNYPVGLKVTDNASPVKSATAYLTIKITIPPIAPSALAGGPYIFCPQSKPWFLDGTGSINPDEGKHEPDKPGDTIKSYEWDLDGSGNFNNATGPQPDVTAFFAAKGPGSYLILLRVTDNTATSFPSSGYPDLTSVDAAEVIVKAATDADCACVDNLSVQSNVDKVVLVWTHTGVPSYNVYRSSVAGGPYTLLANTTSTVSTYTDSSVVVGNTYYYVVREAALSGAELCQSNEVSANVVLGVIPMNIDIYPGKTPNNVVLSRNYTISVAVLGSPSFDVTTINNATVRFGHAGTEAAPVKAPTLKDVNGDGVKDALYGFLTFRCAFQMGDTQGILTGKTTGGMDIKGIDSVLVTP